MEDYNLRPLQNAEVSFATSAASYPLVLTPSAMDFDGDASQFINYLRNNAATLREGIRSNGAMLLRGFPIENPFEFEKSLYALGYDLYRYYTGISPREKITNATYSSTDAAGPFVIGIHTELPYHSIRPSMVSFYCDTQPAIYGETPIFDCAAVFADLSAALQEKLKTRRLRYTRFFSGKKNTLFNFRKPWMDAYLTSDKSVVENQLDEEGICYEWDRKNNLTNEHNLPAVITDPVSGKDCLTVAIFNGDTFGYNISRFAERYSPVKRHLIEWFVRREGANKKAFLHTTFGDGSEINRSESEEIQKTAWANAIVYRWLRGDMLILNNIRFGHARLNVVGPRRIVAAMGDKYDIRELPASPT